MAPNSNQYRWEQSAARDIPVVRIQILEQALNDAADQAGKLAKFIEDAIKDDATTGLLGQTEREQLESWIKDINALVGDRNSLELLIGVQGPTGAGKSSLLNAILGCKDLLPSDSGEAATATICRVSFNHSDDPQKLFQATINFRKHMDVKHELEQFFDDLKERERLLHPQPGEEPMGEDERAKCLEELEANIEEAADKIHKVWGKTINELEKMSVGDLLSKDDPARKYIGSTKTISAPKREEFAAMVKPYLDSTHTEVAGSSGGAKRKMALWPLIDSVDILIKSPLLEGGLVLVDLPGLSDVVGGRAAVARRYYEKLAVAVIVAPCIRAADEQTGANLMTENHEMGMRMDGKFDGRGFCVVLSKIDDIDWAGGSHKASQTGKIEEMMEKRKETRQAIADLTNLISAGKKALKKSKDEEEKATTKRQIKKWRSRKKSHLKADKALKKSISTLGERSRFEVISARNGRLTQRIAKDLRRRHEAFTSRTPNAPKEFKAPPIFPVSARAYWGLFGGAEEAMPGFPSPAYTGIPALNRWLRETTIPQRQRQVLALLHRYLVLMQAVQAWSEDQCKKHHVDASVEELEAAIVEAKCQALDTKLEAFGKELVSSVRKCDPFKSKTAAVEHCASGLVGMVDSWSLKWPNNKNLVTKLNHMTYTAILKRRGDDFISRSGGLKIKYNWMEIMALNFKTQIAAMWIEALHEKIPSCEKPARQKIDKDWKTVTDSIGKALKKFFPGLTDQQAYLTRQVASLMPLKEEMKDKIGQLLADISSSSPQVHEGLQNSLQEKWQSGFKKALKERGGKGVLKRRHAVMLRHAQYHGKSNFREAVDDMEKAFASQRDELLERFQEARQTSVAQFRAQLRLVINNILEAANAEVRMGKGGVTAHIENESCRATRLALQKGVRKILIQWGDVWDTTAVQTDNQGGTDIPKQFAPIEAEEDGDSETDVSDSGSDSDDGDTDMGMGTGGKIIKSESLDA